MKLIFISAGHSKADPGAVGNGLREADVVLEFRDLVADELAKAGVAFRRDGAKGENLTLTEAVRMVPDGGVAVEFHLNAFSAPTATGVETLSRDKNKALGTDLCAAVASVLGIKNRGAKGESSGQHSRLAFASAGGVILELFFVSNPSDVAAYKAKKLALAAAVAKVLVQHANKR